MFESSKNEIHNERSFFALFFEQRPPQVALSILIRKQNNKWISNGIFANLNSAIADLHKFIGRLMSYHDHHLN